MSTLSTSRSRWRGEALASRITDFTSRYIVHPEAAVIKADLDAKERASRLRQCSDVILVLGPPGSGKTKLAAQINKWWPSQINSEVTLRPVVKMKIPKPCTSSNLVKQLLRGVGDPNWSAGKEDDNRGRALHLLKQCETRFLIIDDFQDIPERRDVGGVRVIGNWFRDLIDDVALVFVALGTKEAEEVTLFNDQVRRRATTKRYLRYFEIETQSGRQRWLRLLHEIDAGLPLAEDSCLTEPMTAARIYVATNGIFDYLAKLLCNALIAVVDSQRERLTLEDLRLAYEACHGDIPNGTNPFDDSFVARRLDQPQEPFFDPLAMAQRVA